MFCSSICIASLFYVRALQLIPLCDVKNGSNFIFLQTAL